MELYGLQGPDQITWLNHGFYNRGMKNNGTVANTYLV